MGVISQKDDLYELNTDRVHALAREQLHEEKPVYVPAPELDEKSRKVLISCLNPDGTIKNLPPQPAKLRIILEYLVQVFTPGLNYTEKEVNTILRRFHVDVSGLRRDLVDAGLLDRKRDGSRYWRVDRIDETQKSTAKSATPVLAEGARENAKKKNGLRALSELRGSENERGRDE